jgi:predicted secreted acid phosphatase
MSRALEFCENPQRQQRQQQHQQEYDDNNNEDNFFMARVWLQKSGNEKTSVKHSYSSAVVIPKKLAERYQLNRKCSVLMFPVDEGILIKKLRV